MAIKILDDLIIGDTEWHTSPFKFNVKELNFAGGDVPPIPVSAKLITSDGKNFITTNGDTFLVNGNSDYTSAYTGLEIDEGISEAPTTERYGSIKISPIPIDDPNYVEINGASFGLTSSEGVIAKPDFVNYIDGLYATNPELFSGLPWTQPILTSDTSYGNVSTNYYFAAHPPYMAFDGYIDGGNKYYSDNNAGGDIIWQLPNNIIINSFKVYQTDESSYLGRYPVSIELLGSNNGANWTSLAYSTGYSQPPSLDYIEVNVTSPASYDYYKWIFGPPFNSGFTGMAISEIEINAVTGGDFVYDDTNKIVTIPNYTQQLTTEANPVNTYYYMKVGDDE